MSIIGSNILAGASGQAAGGYEIEQSLRFDGGPYLTRTPAAAGNRRTFTRSVWIKRSKLDIYTIIGPGLNMVPNKFYLSVGTSPESLSWSTTAEYRDVSAWYHVVFQFDTTQATADDRAKLWINGVRISDFTKGATPAQNYESNTVNTTSAEYIGWGYAAWYWHGYQAEHIFVDGQAIDHEDFGEFDDNGVWRPIEYTGTFGTNGYYLKFDPSATNGVGHDHSGNGNHFTPSGFDTANSTAATYDVMSDTPTTNWATLNALAKGSPLTLSNGNLSLTGGHGTTTSTIAVTAGMKAYMEYQFSSSFSDGNDAAGFGVAQRTDPFSSYPGTQSNVWWVYQSNQWYIRPPVGGGNYGYKALSGNTVQIAIDYDAGKVWIGINNTWYDQSNGSSGDPAAGTGEMFSTTFTDSVHFFIHSATSTVNSVNFGQRAFAYTPPTGFNALNTANLPAPSIKNGSKYFDTTLYTGNSAARTISTNSTFTPDFIWIKSRSGAYNHSLQDVVRGFASGKAMGSNLTSAESGISTQAGYVDGVGAGTFDLNADATATWYHVNVSGQTYVAWNWLAGGSGSSNTAGSITSTVSANPTAGFSIIGYTGNGSNNQTIGHGLGVQPSMAILKDRDGNVGWIVDHASLSGNNNLSLNSTDAAFVPGGGSVKSTNSTVLTLVTNNNNDNHNTSGRDYIVYCFAEVEGYSKFGSYTGNGSNDGTFVYTGFRPAWVMVKRSSSSGTAWTIIDSARDDYNPGNHELNAENSQAELTAYERFDLLSNGFKQRSTFGANNLSGATYVYVAFASNPFGGSGVSPATAR